MFTGSLSGITRSKTVLLKSARRKNAGQTMVELLLILPVFLLILFSIMEVGNIAFQNIVANHGAYELARIGSMTAGEPEGDISLAVSRMETAKQEMFPRPERAQLSAATEITSMDPQKTDHINADLVLIVNYQANLVFPISKYLFARIAGSPSGTWPIRIEVRMPIESPFVWE
jgi:hypothetical protein